MLIKQARISGRTRLAAAVALCVGGGSSGLAQEPAGQESVVEEIMVTGSLLRRPVDFPQPVQFIDSEEIRLQQSNSLAELFKVSPQVVSAISTANTQEGGGNTPTQTINLRGLGNRSTLVLLNSRRQTIDGSGTGVDVNNMAPTIMIERVELLLDGASAIYGSDAVAGVVNYITRNNFEGSEMRVDLQRLQASETSRPDFTLGFLTGAQGVNSGVVAGLEYKSTTLLLAEDLWSRERLMNTLPSSFAKPGSFFPWGGNAVADRLPDPLCEDPRLSGPNGLRAGVQVGTACAMMNSLGRTMQPDSSQWNGLAVMHHTFDNGVRAEAELGFAQTEYDIPFGYVTPLLTPYPRVPANNPGVIAANAEDPSFVVQDHGWWGRIKGASDGRIGALHQSGQSTYRVSLGLNGGIGNTGWDWSAAGWMSNSRVYFINNDVVSERFLNALQGYGGQECPYRAATDPEGQFQGATEIGCFWYNPFGNSALASPGEAHYNDPEMMDFIIGKRKNDGTAELRAVEAMVVGDLWEMPGGTTGLALGYQRREQDFEQRWDELTRQGFDPVTGTGYRFNQPAIPDFSGTRNSNSFFAEMVMYPIQGVEVQLAARHEDFRTNSSTDPKIGMIWNTTDNLTLRGTYGTSFRMPTEIQLFGRSPGGASTISIGGEGINARGLTLGNELLEPETSENWTLGLTWDVFDGFSISLDYWDVMFKNLVAAESAQGLLEADMATGFLTNPQIVLFDGAPNEVCETTGRWDPDSGDPAPAGCVTGVDIATVVTSFINQDYRNTGGLDFTMSYDWNAWQSQWRARLSGVYTHTYRISADGLVAEENVGGGTFAKYRANLALDWRRGDHFGRATIRYISPLGPSEVPDGQIDERKAFTTLDLVGGTALPWVDGVNVTASILNVLNTEDPVRFGTLLPVNSGLYDWRKRVFRVGMSASF